MELLTSIGLAVPAGLNAYIPLLTVAVAQRAGWLELRAPYSLLGEWWAIALISVLLVVELAADKIPAVDHVNDIVQTAVRPAAGGLLFVAASPAGGSIHPVVYIVAGVLLAGAVHAAKAGSRPAVNASTGGVGAPVASVIEDIAAFATSVAALVAPYLVAAAAIGIALFLWHLRSRKRRVTPSPPSASGEGAGRGQA